MVKRLPSPSIHWINSLLLIASLWSVCFTGYSQSLSKYRSDRIEVNGIQRDYFIYVPETKSGYFDMPLVLNFHGYGLSAQDQIERSDMSTLAQKDHFIVVYPQGNYLNGKRHWRVGSYTRASRAEDIAFVEELIDHLSEELPIDKDKVYACGFSNGGYFSLRLACTRPDLVAAAASVGGTMSQENYDGCLTSRGVPVFLINGSQDAIVPRKIRKRLYANSTVFKNGAERMTVTTEAIKPLRWIAQNKTMLKEYDTSMATVHFEYSKTLLKEEVMNGLMSRGVDTTLHTKSGCF